MKSPKLEKILLIPDSHFPYEDKKAFELLLKVGKDFKPHHSIILGDFIDCYSVSSHSKNPNRSMKLAEEVEATKVALDKVKALGAKNNVFVSGNHEDRLERYLMDKAPELFNFISTPHILDLKEKGFKYVPYKKSYKIGKLNITHDTGVAGRFAHYKSMDAFQHNIVIGHCLPWSYKVMTPNGPVRFNDLKIGDDVLSYNKGQVVITKVLEKVHYEYDGEMASFDNNAISMEMTSKHHIYTNDGRYIPVQEALTILTKENLVTSALPLDQPEFDISDDMLKLVIAFCADGTLSHTKDFPQIKWRFKKERKIERLTNLIENLGYNIAWSNPSKDNGSVNTKGLDLELRIKLMEYAPGKILPKWLLKLSARQRQIVVDELPLWDGSVITDDGIDYGSRQFCSWKREEIEMVQTLLIQHGIRSTLVSKDTVVRFNIEKKKYDSRRKLKDFVTWEKVEKLEVGCITTEFQNFFVMTDNGNIELSGNTHRLGYAVEGNAQGERHVTAMFGWLGDVNQVDYMHRIKAVRDWSLGFGIGYLNPQNGVVYLVPVPIINYTCLVEGKLFTL